jgi:tetratricopeptide (TPR) repeat protein
MRFLFTFTLSALASCTPLRVTTPSPPRVELTTDDVAVEGTSLASDYVREALEKSGHFKVHRTCTPETCLEPQYISVRIGTCSRKVVHDTEAPDGPAYAFARGTCVGYLLVQNADGDSFYQRSALGVVEGPDNAVLELSAAVKAIDVLLADLMPSTSTSTFWLSVVDSLPEATWLAVDGHYAQALSLLQAHVATNPDDGVARYHFGAVLTAAGQLQEGTKQLQHAERLEPERYRGEADKALRRQLNAERVQRHRLR